ncbi:MAG: ester cyclase [Acidobacteriota bacterium]|nr:ester cyclase [Acidobacteriota bacterium]
MTSDEIRSFLDRFVLAWGRGDAATLGALYADDCIVVSPIFRTLKGRAQVERSYVDLFKAFEQETIRVDDIVIEVPARAVVVWTAHSTQVGEIFGMPPTGKKIERTIAYILTLQDGRIAKEVRIYDFTSMLMQIGVLRAKPA